MLSQIFSKKIVNLLLIFLSVGIVDLVAEPKDFDVQKNAKKHKQKQELNDFVPLEVESLKNFSLMLGRPTDKSIILNVLSNQTTEGYCEYGAKPALYTNKTSMLSFLAGEPKEILLDKLSSNSQYYYRCHYRKGGDEVFVSTLEHSFHTQRGRDSAFTFEIQGDSHPERKQQFDAQLYTQTLSAAAMDHPDFYITMGDDFSVDTLPTVNKDTVASRYLLQRAFLALLGHSTPVFLVNGNHEQASAANLDGTPNNVAVWAQRARNKLFSPPVPDGFYSGNKTPVEFIGHLGDYYAWEWGNALFVVIDPYWHSSQAVDNVFGGGDKTKDKWSVTLGSEQYQWFKKTLSSSKAKYKFVFSHHVLGSGRGGIELADTFEWGGKNKKGVMEFAQKRPDWELPIHQLMVKYGVTIFFQGHDHLFAKQQLDGVVYQTLPEPADPNYTLYNQQAFLSGDIFPNSGRVRVNVSKEKVRVEYIRSYLPKDFTTDKQNNQVAFAYEILR